MPKCKNTKSATYLIAVFTAAFLVCTSMSVHAAAAPDVKHTPVTVAYADTYLEVSATAAAEAGIERAEVFFRAVGTKEYYRMLMEGSADSLSAFIPGSLITGSELEYYIEVADSAKQLGLAGSAENPYRVPVKHDTSAPTVTLMEPDRNKADIPLNGASIMLIIDDAVANQDLSSIKVLWDGVDVTKDAAVSAIMLIYAPEQLKEGRHTLQVTVSDTAGNQTISPKWTFYAKEIVEPKLEVSGNLSAAVNYDDTDGGWQPEWKLGTEVGYGGLSVKVDVDPAAVADKPGQSATKATLAYEGDWLQLSVIDTSASLSQLLLKDYTVRGGVVALQLGPLGLKVAGGTAAEAVKGTSYARYMAGVRPSLKLWTLDTGLDVVSIWDKYDEKLRIETKPEQTVGLGLDTNLEIGEFQLAGDASVSVYFDNATKWWVYKGRTIPIPDPLSSPPRVDSSFKVNLETPLPLMKLKADYVHTGPNYKTLGASVTPDEKGYSVDLETIKLFGVIGLSSGYSHIDSNIKGPVDIGKILAKYGFGGSSGSPQPALTPETTVTRNTKLSITPSGWPSLEAKFEEVTVSEPVTKSTDGQNNLTTSYALDLAGIKIPLGFAEGRFGGGYALGSFTDRMVPDQTKDKATNTVKFTASLARGPVELQYEGSLKSESDLRGASTDLVVENPSHKLKVELKPLRDLSLRAAVKLDSTQNNANVQKDKVNNEKTTFETGFSWTLLDWIKVSGQLENVQYRDAQTPSKNYRSTKAKTGFEVTF